MKINISIKNILVTSYILIMLFYVYASATGISIRGVVLISCGTLILFMVLGQYISVERGEVLWLMAVAVMFLWTRRIDPDVIYYDVIFLLTICILIVLQSPKLEVKASYVLKILISMSFATVCLVILELVLKTRMQGFLSVFLPSDALNDELLYISAGTGLRGLASSTNAVSLAAFIVFTYAIYIYHNNNKIVRIICIVMSIVALIVCGERSNFIFVPLTIVFVYLVYSKNTKGLKYIKLIFVVLLILSVLIIIKPQLEQIPALKRTFRTLDMLQAGSEIAGERSILYQRAIEMWYDKPLLGHGWFEFYYQNTGILNPGSNSHAHNLLLESLAELGIIGTFLLFIPICYAIYINIVLLKKYNDINIQYKNMLLFVLAIQVFFMLDSMLHLTFFSPRIILYLISLFLLYNIKRKVSKDTKQNYEKKCRNLS